MKEKAIKHIDYCMRLARTQVEREDYFLFEHPAHATSWGSEAIEKMMHEPGVNDTVADQCMYWLVTPNADRTEFVPAKTPTKFMSSRWYVLGELSTRCDKSHVHQPLMGGRASKAQEYTCDLCRAICRGVVKQRMYGRSGKACTGSMQLRQLKSLITNIQQWQETED